MLKSSDLYNSFNKIKRLYKYLQYYIQITVLYHKMTNYYINIYELVRFNKQIKSYKNSYVQKDLYIHNLIQIFVIIRPIFVYFIANRLQ